MSPIDFSKPDFETYRYTKLYTFHKYNSWVGPNEKQKIPSKSLKTLKNFSEKSSPDFKKTSLFGGTKVKFLGGIFEKDEMLIFFDSCIFYCKGYWLTNEVLGMYVSDKEKPKHSGLMRYDFHYKFVYENNWISEFGERCVGTEFEKKLDLGYSYYWGKGSSTIYSKDIHECLQEIQNDINSRKNKKENVKKIKEKKRIDVLNKKKGSIIDKFDKDKNGTIDIIEDKNEFNLLLKKHQKVVVEKGKEFNENYTHQFIKVGNYIKQKRSNLQLIFDCIKQVQNQKDLSDFVKILEVEIHSYNLLLINSLNLIVSLIEDDQITFYEIYERFDKLNIFNSNWENEVSEKLSELNKGINELNQNLKGVMYEIRDMGDRIVSSIEDLSYITEESTKLLDNRLGEIDSSIQTNNLLTLIQTYQTYKINKNTKSLRG